MNTNESFSSSPNASANRRDFLHQAAVIAGGMAVLASDAQAEPPPKENSLHTIKLGPHAVTRLIIGGNPIYGYSHFNKLLSKHQTDWHTPERVIALLKRCEQAG